MDIQKILDNQIEARRGKIAKAQTPKASGKISYEERQRTTEGMSLKEMKGEYQQLKSQYDELKKEGVKVLEEGKRGEAKVIRDQLHEFTPRLSLLNNEIHRQERAAESPPPPGEPTAKAEASITRTFEGPEPEPSGPPEPPPFTLPEGTTPEQLGRPPLPPRDAPPLPPRDATTEEAGAPPLPPRDAPAAPKAPAAPVGKEALLAAIRKGQDLKPVDKKGTAPTAPEAKDDLLAQIQKDIHLKPVSVDKDTNIQTKDKSAKVKALEQAKEIASKVVIDETLTQEEREVQDRLAKFEASDSEWAEDRYDIDQVESEPVTTGAKTEESTAKTPPKQPTTPKQTTSPPIEQDTTDVDVDAFNKEILKRQQPPSDFGFDEPDDEEEFW